MRVREPSFDVIRVYVYNTADVILSYLNISKNIVYSKILVRSGKYFLNRLHIIYYNKCENRLLMRLKRVFSAPPFLLATHSCTFSKIFIV